MTRVTFFCENPIDAFFMNGQKHACIARGVFSTSDEHLAAFLKTYPGVSVLSEEEDRPAAFNAGQYPQCPEPVVVINGGFSGGGAMAARPKKQ
jgi:hypothetical protein